MSERASFNLITEPWIPCETPSGERVELGLADVLCRAHELRAMHDGSPIVTAAIHRLLLAVLHRCFGPAGLEAWKDIWRAARFDETAVRSYLRTWRHRFDLFDAERPFYQCPEVGSPQLELKSLPIIELAMERSSYAGTVHLFEPTPVSALEDAAPAEAARHLLAFLGYASGGRIMNEPSSRKEAPLRAGALVLVAGANLFETLTLNLLDHGPKHEPIPCVGGDMPAWEQSLPAQREERPPRGWLDWLTWQSRRVLLCPVDGGRGIRVTTVTMAAGADVSGDVVLDPMKAWKRSEKSGFIPLRFDPDRALWRDSEALLRLRRGDRGSLPPRACDRVESMVLRRLIPPERRFELVLLGMATNQARIELWRHERMPLPPSILADQERVAELGEALGEAEEAAGVLDQALKRFTTSVLSPGYDPHDQGKARKPLAENVTQLVNTTRAIGTYWSSLREPFDALLLGLGADDGGAEARDAWRRRLSTTARSAYEQASRAFGATARTLKGAACGQEVLHRGLAKLLPAAPQGEIQ
ncbi:MAG: type I-E CRISPR-associated protein Cse1/CasA [Polyangiaceae bacterium]|nr:type I-E CRISPR-associated protein Cse1/CasA [Polyangiaceae bacterium]